MTRPGRPALRALPCGPTVVAEESPADPGSLAATVAVLLRGLGADRHEVARNLAAAGLRGWPGHPDMDPLCRWLYREIPTAGVWLAGTWLRAWVRAADGRRETVEVALPAAVADYTRAAREGAYPHLRLSYAPPVVPVPHVERGDGRQSPPWPIGRPPAAPGVDRPVDRAAPVNSAGSGQQRDLYQVLSVPLADGGAGQDDRAVIRADRATAHEAYGDAVALALELRGITVTRHGTWPPAVDGSDALRAEGRRITLDLDPQAWTAAWPGYIYLYLHWSERYGWTLVPIRDDGHADALAALSWWDTCAASEVLPAPAALAAWVAAVAEHGPDTGPHLPTGAVAAGVRPLWRDVATDDTLEAILDSYRGCAGHRVAAHDRDRDALADTALLHPVEAGSRL